MAEAVGVSPSTWGTYENDSSFPAPKTIDKFCMLFHVNTQTKKDTSCTESPKNTVKFGE